MTTIEIISRIARRARNGGDFTKLSLLERMDVLSAINTGIGEVYNELPVRLKEQTEGFTLPAPLAITGLVVTQGSRVLGGYVFNTDQIGRSILINGDGMLNQLIGTGTALSLMNSYAGPSGTVGATIYGDAIYSQVYPFDRIIGNPEFSDGRFYPLIRQSVQRYDYPWLSQQLQLGVPFTWWVQMMGNSQGNIPAQVLRFYPMPDQDYRIRVRMGFWARRLLMTDYDAATTITVLDQFIEPALIPLAMRAFMLSPAWEPRRNDELVLTAAERAIQFLRNQPGQVGAPNNHVFTPAGY